MRRKVLIVDDEQVVADTLAIIFQKQGYECRVSYTGNEAVALAGNFRPDLLLCDIAMPDRNGLDVASTIVEQCPDCRVIVLTGQYSHLPAAWQWASCHPGIARVLTKPLLPDRLLKKVEAAFNS